MEFVGVALVWGPPRSGTTWLFNVVREMLTKANINHAAWVSGQHPHVPADFQSLVVKSHQAELLDTLLTAPALDHVYPIVILRNAHDAYQSLIRTQEEEREALLSWLERDITSIEGALHVLPNARAIRVEWIARESIDLLGELADYLGIVLQPTEIRAIAGKFSLPAVRKLLHELGAQRNWTGSFQEFDIESQWHANHLAPIDFAPAGLTQQEHERLQALQGVMDDLVSRYSLMSLGETDHLAKMMTHRHCDQSTPTHIIQDIEQRFRLRRWRDRLPLIRGKSLSR